MNTQTPKAVEPVTANDFDGKLGKRLTKQQIDAVRRMTYYRACLMRTQGMWSPAEEAAFLNGAQSVFHALKCADQIPAFWIMGSRPILDALADWKAQGRKLA